MSTRPYGTTPFGDDSAIWQDRLLFIWLRLLWLLWPIMSLLIRYAHMPFYFRFPSLSLHRQSTTMHLCSDATTRQSHLLHWTDLTYLIDIWLMIHMYLLLFLVSPTCPLLRSDQSRVLAPHGQALSIASPYACILVYHSYLTCLYLPFTKRRSLPKPQPIAYMSLPQNWDFALTLHTILHLFCTILHYFASHRTAMIPPSLLATIHLETILTPRSHPLRAP